MGNSYDFLIIGAGLFGSIFAHEAHLLGKKCLVIDKRDHIGGNCYTEKIADINVHKYINIMPKKKKEGPIQDNQVPHNCVTCKNWVSKGELEKREWVDIINGFCTRNGMYCSHMWVCKAWEYGRLFVKPQIED